MAILAYISLCIWLYLVFLHGRFWSSTPEITARRPAHTPGVDIIVPARDEAATVAPVVRSLLQQDYSGSFRVILVDDNSSDDTAARAGADPRLTILRLTDKPSGWTGKLFALSRGVAASTNELIFFTDADIEHDSRHLSALVAALLERELDMVSEMVALHCTSVPERALVPAFVYFFQMLYPFAQVNDRRSTVAAAAGGTVLIRRAFLNEIGGVEVIKHALIDDVALATEAKRRGRIFLGHSRLAASIRLYPRFQDIWQMVARTAFTQLRYSAMALLVTLAGLMLVWWVPLLGLTFSRGPARAAAALGCLLACLSYLPTLNRYRCSPLWTLTLPLIALFYISATIGSAVNHWRGAGARWKQRSYEA